MKDLHFYLLRDVLNPPSIIVDGRVYQSNPAGKDTLTYDGIAHKIRYEGSIADIIRINELLEHDEITAMKAQAHEQAFKKAVETSNYKPMDLFICQVVSEVLPYLHEFDPRGDHLSLTELADLRKSEMLDKMLGNKQACGTADLQVLKKLIMEQRGNNSFDMECSALFIGDKHACLKPRSYQGDVTASIEGEVQLFKAGAWSDERFISDLEGCRRDHYITASADDLRQSHADLFKKYLALITGIGKDFKESLEYRCCGYRMLIDGTAFVYLKPRGFAMHDIREGFTERWYPFPEPPKVGVRLHIHDEEIKLADNRPHIDGDFDYLNFSSDNDNIRSFCMTSRHVYEEERWPVAAVNTIMHGINTLFNGMDQNSLWEFSRNKVPGEGYKPPLSEREWLAEDQVERAGLLKTNLHEIVPARI